MSDTFDPAAMDAKLDSILGQLSTITNRLNSHDTRLGRIEKAKIDTNDNGIPDATGPRKSTGGGHDHRDGGEDIHGGGDDHDARDDRGRAGKNSVTAHSVIGSDMAGRATASTAAPSCRGMGLWL
jgi:hypothetical protein